MRNISLCMIVKDEEKFLRSCLESVKGVVDEIIIVDTGSTDNTKKIAEEFNAKIFDYAWNDDFASARNYGIDQATGYWILHLDADEQLHHDDRNLVKELAQTGDHEAYFFEVEDQNAAERLGSIRFFRNRPSYRYVGRLHEFIKFSDDGELYSMYARTSVRILHFGYTHEVADQKRKAERSDRILKLMHADDPLDPRTNYYLGQAAFNKGDYEESIRYYKISFDNDDRAGNPSAVYNLGILLENLDRYQEAIEYLDRGIKIYSDYTDLYYIRGLTYFRLDRLDEAIADFEKCIELGPAPAIHTTLGKAVITVAKRELATCLMLKGELSRARDLYFEALQDDPRDSFCFRNLAKLLLEHHPRELVKTELLRIVDQGDPAIQTVISELFGYAN